MPVNSFLIHSWIELGPTVVIMFSSYAIVHLNTVACGCIFYFKTSQRYN